MTRTSITRFLLTRGVAATMALGVVALGAVGLSQAVPAAPAVSGAAGIPVTMTTESPASASVDALCQAALEAVATGRPVPVAAAPCLRAFVLDADAGPEVSAVRARPAPEACEALLPSLATGAPVLLGAALPCVEDYVALGGREMAAR